MDDPLLVGGLESLADLTRDRQCFIQWNQTTGDPIRQRVALDQFEDERVSLTAVLEPINRPNVRVVERGQHLRLALETGDAIRITCEGFRQDLQRDLAIQLGIARAIHLAHAARSEGGTNFVRAEASAGEQRHEAPDDRLALIVVEWDLP